MHRRYTRVLSAAALASAITAGVTVAPAAASRGHAVAAAATSATSAMRVGPNFPMLPTSEPLYGRDAVGLAVNPRNPNHRVMIYSDYQSLWCEVAVSTNGGIKWRRSRLKAPAGFITPPCTVGNHLANFQDGGITFGKGNTVYVTFASGILDAQGDSRGKSVLIARSNDGGRTFGVGQVVLPGGEDVDVGPDHTLPKLVVDPGTGGGADRIHIVANRTVDPAGPAPAQNSVVVVTSRDGGSTWGPDVTASLAGQSSIEASEPAIGKDDALYVAFRTQRAGSAPGRYLPEGSIVVARSTDLGNTWTRTITAGVKGFVYAGPPLQLYGSTQQFTASSFPRLAADQNSGNVYLVYNNGEVPLSQAQAVQAADHFIHNNSDVWFQRSTDGGSQWSLPRRLNRDAKIQLEITQTRHPNLSVAPNGRVDVVWQDRRHWYLGPPRRLEGFGTCTHTHIECEEARLGDTYYRSSDDGGASFGREHRITDRSINNDVGYDYRFGVYWDYGPKSIPIGNDRIMFAWMDSRDGNVETDTLGIYLAEADLKGSYDVPLQRVSRTSAAGLALQMSRRAYPGGSEATLAATFASRPWSRVVIVNERDLAGVLAGGVLGRAFLGPVLITPSNGLSAAVKQEVARLAPVGAYVIGGEGSLSAQVVADLAATGVPADQIIRLAGPDDAGTAAQIATTMDRRTAVQKTQAKPAFDAAVIVNPASPDAAAISALAANRRFPVLLTSADALPAATTAALQALAVPRTIVVGSSEWVGDGVLAGLPKPQRIAGSNAVATSRAILAQSQRWGLPTNVVFSTRASRKMDAAVMGATVGRINGMLLLSPKGAPEAAKILGQMKIRTLVDQLVMADKP
jgi:hypothetical protein